MINALCVLDRPAATVVIAVLRTRRRNVTHIIILTSHSSRRKTTSSSHLISISLGILVPSTTRFTAPFPFVLLFIPQRNTNVPTRVQRQTKGDGPLAKRPPIDYSVVLSYRITTLIPYTLYDVTTVITFIAPNLWHHVSYFRDIFDDVNLA
jgi:hypothetical protein